MGYGHMMWVQHHESLTDCGQISTMRPTTSFTVPPSTIFATRPISFYPPPRVSNKPTKTPNVIEEEDVSMEGDDVSTQRVTAVGVLKGEKMGDEEQGRVIWVWRGEEGEHVVLKVYTSPVQKLMCCSSKALYKQSIMSKTTADQYCVFTPTDMLQSSTRPSNSVPSPSVRPRT